MHEDNKEFAYTLLCCVCNHDTYISLMLTIHVTHQWYHCKSDWSLISAYTNGHSRASSSLPACTSSLIFCWRSLSGCKSAPKFLPSHIALESWSATCKHWLTQLGWLGAQVSNHSWRYSIFEIRKVNLTNPDLPQLDGTKKHNRMVCNSTAATVLVIVYSCIGLACCMTARLLICHVMHSLSTKWTYSKVALESDEQFRPIARYALGTLDLDGEGSRLLCALASELPLLADKINIVVE